MSLHLAAADHVLTRQDSSWHDLNMDIVAARLQHHSVLQSGKIEFLRLLEPIHNHQRLEDRRQVILELEQNLPALEAHIPQLAATEPILVELIGRGTRPPELSAIESLFKGIFITALSGFAINMAQRHVRHDWHDNNYFSVAAKIFFSAWTLWETLREVFTHLNGARRKTYQFDGDVMQLARLLSQARTLTQIVRESPVLAVAFLVLLDFEDQAIIEPAFGQLIYDIQHYPKAWTYWNSEDIYERALIHHEKFEALLWAVGRLDAYLTIVRILHHRTQNQLPVTLATFHDDSTRPNFVLQNLDNLLVGESVLNDFELDGHAIFNGPSTCGKSAAMKSIAIAHILAQSILLVPARQAHLAMLDHIGTYFNVGDDIARGASSFKAQNIAMRELEHKARATDARMLMLVDEPYKGVPNSIGEKLVTDFITRIAKLPHVSLLASTHYDMPCRIPNAGDISVKYFQPELAYNGNEFVRTYKILPGVADWWFENQNGLADAFINQIFLEP